MDLLTTFLIFILLICKINSYRSPFNPIRILTQNSPRTALLSHYNPLNSLSHTACSVRNTTGVCLHSYECIAGGGVPLGTCRSGYLFGSCCTSSPLVSALTKVTFQSNGIIRPEIYSSQQCGLRSKRFERRGLIYNGEKVNFGEFPWQVSLRRVFQLKETLPWCGGALISDQWVLSAAHCFRRRMPPSKIIARLGTIHSKKNNNHFPFVEIRIFVKLDHPHYFQKKGVNSFDIAMLKMEKPVRFQPHIQPICLPAVATTVTKGTGTVAGFGETEQKAGSKNLLKITVPILSLAECASYYQDEGVTIHLNNRIFCAGFKTGEKDACQGDSGSPLQVEDANGRVYVAGVVSTGIGCGKPNFPGLYTNVAAFVPWILETISKY